MKDSGVEWIGRIPNHWRIGNIKMLLAEVEYGLSEAASDFGDVEFLTMGNVQNGEVIRTRQKVLSDVPKHMLLREGDILFNRTNSLDLVGKVGIFREQESDPVTFASYLVRLRCKEQINPEYLTYYLGCEPFLAVARTMALPSVSQANLNPNRYGFLPAPIPPKKEQDAIVDVIVASEKRLKHLVSKTQTSIDLLKERRAALITAAVTGQIDLREEAA
jgi:type I restriction enzyme S subunit